MADYSQFVYLKVEREDKVLVVTLNRPDSMNAISTPVHRELEELFLKIATDRETNAVVLTGAGTRAFSAGGDIRAMADRANNAKERLQNSMDSCLGGRRLLVSLLEIEQPIICAMNGDAVGLGATLALFCDVVIASEKARIGDPHVRVGLVAGDGGAVIWPALVGVNKAKEMLMTGDLLKAPEAERIGLVNRVLPAEEVLPAAKELAHRLANGPILAIKWSKVSVNQVLRERLNLILGTSLGLETLSMISDDHKEAANAFADKRTPEFKGR